MRESELISETAKASDYEMAFNQTTEELVTQKELKSIQHNEQVDEVKWLIPDNHSVSREEQLEPINDDLDY